MPSLAGETLREADMWGVTPLDQLWCRITFKRARYAGALTPPGPTPSIMYPGYAGGMNWGSVSIDHSRRSEEHTSELQSLMRNSYAVFCLKKKEENHNRITDAVTAVATEQKN